jgi:DNA-binding beta-propeller fold protein YncE
MRTTLFFLFIFIVGCKVDDRIINIKESGYPISIAKILLTKCATPGCHNSKTRSSGLNLETWQEMVKGTNNGAVIIPYWHNQSSLFTFSNTHADLGVMNKPTMPSNAEPLSKEEVTMLKDWINDGAKNVKGEVFYTSLSTNAKYYVANQGCDLVFEIDAKNFIQTRVVKVGANALIESPHQLHVSADGLYFYVVLLNGLSIEKYSTKSMSKVGEISLNNGSGSGSGNWNTFIFSPDNKHAYVVDWSAQGVINYIDLEQMKVLRVYAYDWLKYPHGITLNPSGNTLYVLSQSGNAMYKINVTDPLFPELIATVSLDGNPIQYDASNAASLNPHDIRFDLTGQYYFVTCQKSNEVRVYNLNDVLVKSIAVGSYPQEIFLSIKWNRAFVSCTEDTITTSKLRGSVAVIDLNTMSLIKKIYTGHQPHGMAINDNNNEVIVANRNQTSDGPAPHHSSDCIGRNGNLVSIDENTLQLKKKKIEVSVDPYYLDFKY